MTFRGVLSNLLIVFIISILLNTESTNALKLPSMSQVLNSLSKVCHKVEALPEKVCHNTVGLVGIKAKHTCGLGATHLCKKIPLSMKQFKGTFKKRINECVCGSIDKAIGMVEKECTGELEKYTVIGYGYDANGNKVSICNGPPTTVEGVCTMLVAAICRQLPPLLHSFNRLCQMTFARLICQDVINAAKPVVSNLLG